MSVSSPATVGIADAKSRRKAMIRRITVTAILTAMAFILMYLEVPLPFMPPFLKFDFSEIPVLVGAFALGPVWGIVIELFKNLIHLPFTATAGIGELSNFVTGSIFVGFSGLVYLKLHTRKGAAAAMAVGTRGHRSPDQRIHHPAALRLRNEFLHRSHRRHERQSQSPHQGQDDAALFRLRSLQSFQGYRCIGNNVLRL